MLCKEVSGKKVGQLLRRLKGTGAGRFEETMFRSI